MTTKSLGDTFVWFIGVVENRDDPQKAGRVQMRILNIHGDEADAPTNTLPWATVLMPGFSASLNEVGQSATGLQVGSTCIGFFMDGDEKQMPIIFGVMPGNADIPKLAKEQQTINKEIVAPEPASAYAAKYPFNKVFKSESGHIFEVDDTPNHERLHTYHRSGTYTEIDETGRRVDKIVGDGFEIVVKNKTIHVIGNVDMKVDGNMNVSVGGNYSLDVKGAVTVKGNPINLN